MKNYGNINSDLLRVWQQHIAAGDQHAFRQLFNAFAERLTYFAFSITRNKEASMEIMDEVFIRIWKNRSHLPEIDNITTYLYTAIKNTSLNYLSKKANEQITQPFDFLNVLLEENASPEQSLISSEIMKKIQAAVENLPPKCKMIFKLVREDGLKYKEVADVLNISVNTVDAQMVIAVKKISEKVKAHFDFFPGKKHEKKQDFL